MSSFRQDHNDDRFSEFSVYCHFKVQSSVIHHYFGTTSANVYTMKKQISSQCCYENHFDFVPKGSWAPLWVHRPHFKNVHILRND